MIYSMTGFASLEKSTSSGTLVIELRSVNHRYLELQLKLDDNLRALEPMLRELISSKLGRGKVECRIYLTHKNETAKSLNLDHNVLNQLSHISQTIQQQFPQSAALSVADILRWPGVLQNEETDHIDLSAEVSAGLQQVLADMSRARAREGEKLKDMILQRLAEIESLVDAVKPLLPGYIKSYQEKLTAKLHETLKSVDEERIRQELVIYAQRIDVDEELSRLGAHISEVKRILHSDMAAGKRLDFLMQELNREANTLGSKSVSTEVSQVSMALKVLIEQMREQVQNIE
jgi:uncharacterized protein (TIGR00255 family)